jgi:hypothetical protein
VGDTRATQGPTPCRVLLDLSESQRSFGRCNPIFDQRNAGNACRQLLLRAENRRRSIQGAPLFLTRVETALKRLPICVRLPSLADGAQEALFPGGLSMTSGASGSADPGGRPASAAGAAYRRSSLFFETSSRGVASLRKAPGGAARRSAQAVAIWFFCAARAAEACMRSKAEQLWRASDKAFVVTLEVQTFELRDRSKVRLSAREVERASSHDLILLRSHLTRGRSICGERELSTRTKSMRSALTATKADNPDRSAGNFGSSPTFRPVSSLLAELRADLHADLAVIAPSHHAAPGTADPASSFAATNHFTDCARLASLADDANGALNLRAPSLDSVDGPFGLVLLPASDSGAARSCSPGPSSSGSVPCRGAVMQRARSEAEAAPSAWTATAVNNRDRSAGRAASPPVDHSVSRPSAARPADLHALVAAAASNCASALGIIDPVRSLALTPGAPA